MVCACFVEVQNDKCNELYLLFFKCFGIASSTKAREDGLNEEVEDIGI